MRHVVFDDGKTGKLVPCPACHTWLAHSRLTPEEQQTSLSHITGGGSAGTLRRLGEQMLGDPFGWFMVWGGTGSAKTLFLHALTAGFCRAGTEARYYHAADLADGLYRDIEGDSANHELYRRIPVLVIDELDKFRLTDWSRKQLQALLDDRYRNMRTHMTLFAANRDPFDDEWLPDDIKSRLSDGRFRRVVDGREHPGVYQVKAPDMRPNLRREQS